MRRDIERWGDVDEEDQQVPRAADAGTAHRLRERGQYPVAGGLHRTVIRVDPRDAARIRHHDAQPGRTQPPQPPGQLTVAVHWDGQADGQGHSEPWWRTDASTRSSTALSFSGSSPDASRATSPSSTSSR